MRLYINTFHFRLSILFQLISFFFVLFLRFEKHVLYLPDKCTCIYQICCSLTRQISPSFSMLPKEIFFEHSCITNAEVLQEKEWKQLLGKIKGALLSKET